MSTKNTKAGCQTCKSGESSQLVHGSIYKGRKRAIYLNRQNKLEEIPSGKQKFTAVSEVINFQLQGPPKKKFGAKND